VTAPKLVVCRPEEAGRGGPMTRYGPAGLLDRSGHQREQKETHMSELIRHDYYDSAPVSRHTRKELERREQNAILRQAALAAAAEEARQEIQVQDQLAYGRALLRIRGTYDMAKYAKRRATEINRDTELESRGDPYLEHVHRRYEATAAVVGEMVIYDYGTGR
jgi:hypothetical protein